MNTPQFVHLHVHTEYSIVDGLVRVKPLISAAAEMGMPAVAVTDQTNLFAMIKFYSGAISAGIKPICGCDVMLQNPDNPDRPYPMVLLVKDLTGYRNLTRLISRAYTENQGQGVPVIQKSWLQGMSQGLIALSGGHYGEIGRLLLDGDEQGAAEVLYNSMKLFPDSFYLELQRCGRPGEDAYIQAVIELSAKHNCPLVATNDVRFLKSDDFEAHEVRVCIHERRTLDDPRRSRHYTEQQYLRSPSEMAELFSDIPEALENSVVIARRCNLDIELGKPFLPNYPVPAGMTMDEYFRQLSLEGLEQRLAGDFSVEGMSENEIFAGRKPYLERLEFELDVIIQMGFPGYFLIVMEFIQWAKNNDIPVGPGRGSGAGSIVAYALGITDLDPLKYDLLFERFLNPERVSMPDFDVDFCMEGRDRVIQHVAELYGKDAVSQIITFGTMAAKAVVRDVARVQGKSYGLADKLSKLIPFEVGMTLSKAMEQEPALKEFVDSDEDAQEIMEMAFKLEGITRNVGKHAGGVVIAPTVLTDFSPLYCDENGEGLVTQFDKNDVETAGLVKFDFLGLRTLTIIDWAVKMINAQEPAHIKQPLDITSIPLDDMQVYQLLQRAETTAVFQLESRGMKELIRRLLPSCFEDIVALVALFRPGPLQSGMVDDFINRKHGRADVAYPHPDLEPVLKNTYGVILYQEQVMQIAQVLANYSLGGADMLRRAMGKKKQEEMDKQRSIFLEGAAQNGLDPALAGSIFDLMEKFAGYGFNKSHSAAYALVSYQTAWLKHHYPAYFMAAVLSADMQNTDKVVTLIEECRQMGLPIVAPAVNIGAYNFTVNEQGEIVYGLGAIKGLGEGPVSAIIHAREQGGPFASFLDFCSRVDLRSVNKRALEALIRAGALDCVVDAMPDQARAQLMASLQDTVQAAEQSLRNKDAGVLDMFGDISPVADQENTGTLLSARPWSQQQRLREEKETLGLYLSGHPIDEFLSELSGLTRDRLVNVKPEREAQWVGGLLVGVRTMRNKRGDLIAFLTLDDRSARLEVSLFAREYEQYREVLEKDAILLVECQVSADEFSGGLRGRAKQVLNLVQARQRFASALELTVQADRLAVDFSRRLADCLRPYCEVFLPVESDSSEPDSDDRADVPRPCQVRIRYERADVSGWLMLGDQWYVRPEQSLLQELSELCAPGTVTIAYQ
ncbi:DNA polymerase III subunit alpha [Pseudohongiella spirulinae]|uniref:DNA polymerase III subunit alpha n=1 Tax=Pseudohongiella spirulinae TaxID=1249552 RepID=A0A0S2KDA2_9GAMM|nr:DNA polymerase III subunit alpha [Pseudohongiella spirulinae]ALO46052.1 DNA polymerase III subunit alpha [Pseudohongiella spirulinae]